MKSFLEEYGFGILTAIVVIMLLCLSTPIGETIGDSVKSLVNNFGEKTNSVMNVAGDTTEQLANSIKNGFDENSILDDIDNGYDFKIEIVKDMSGAFRLVALDEKGKLSSANTSEYENGNTIDLKFNMNTYENDQPVSHPINIDTIHAETLHGYSNIFEYINENNSEKLNGNIVYGKSIIQNSNAFSSIDNRNFFTIQIVYKGTVIYESNSLTFKEISDYMKN